MARLEQAITTIVDVFMQYADGDGKLTADELKNMLTKEIENDEVKDKLTRGDCKKFMRRDRNNDGLDFKEFSKCMCFMLNCHYGKKTGKGEECGVECD